MSYDRKCSIKCSKGKRCGFKYYDKRFRNNSIIHVEQVQDIVEDVLIKSEFSNVTKLILDMTRKSISQRNFENQSKFIKTIENYIPRIRRKQL